MLRFLSLALLCLSSVSAVELLGRAELDACLVRMETMTSEKKMTHLGAAWNELKPHERVPILKSIAMLEEAEADPEEISYIANLNDDAPAEKAHCTCPAVVSPPVCRSRSKGYMRKHGSKSPTEQTNTYQPFPAHTLSPPWCAPLTPIPSQPASRAA